MKSKKYERNTVQHRLLFRKSLVLVTKTIARYEGGALQDAAPNNLIVLMKNRENFIKLWQLNKSKLDPKENEAIESAWDIKLFRYRLAQKAIIHASQLLL